MIKFKNGEFLEVSNQIEKITVEKINICIFAPDEENMHIMYQPTSGTSIKARKYPILIEGDSCSVSRIKRNILQFMEELYESLDYIEYKGIISISVPSTLIYCYKLFCTNGYWNQELLEFMDVIHDLVFSCNDESYEKYKQIECTEFISDSVLNMVDDYIKRTEYSDIVFNLGRRNGKQKLLDDFKDAFMNFEPKVYTDKDWLDAYKYETRNFENAIIELKENEKMPTKDFERIEGISIVGTHNGFAELDDFINERNKMKIDKVIFNKPATIVFWKDGTKTIVKADEEKFDPEKGLAMAISKKAYGNEGNYYNVFRKWIKGDIKDGKKKK